MTISAAAPLKDGVISATGGSAVPFSSIGDNIGENHVFFDGTDIRTRSSGTFVSKAPKKSVNTPSGYTQQRNTAVLHFPLTLASGEVVVNTVRIEIATDVETSDAVKETIRGLAAQVIYENAFDEFWNHGVVS